MPTILDLLMALNRGDLPPVPAPAKPVGLTTAGQPQPGAMIGPSEPRTMEEMAANSVAPVAPAPGFDWNLVNQFAGPAPVAPTEQPPSTLAKIGAVLSGIGIGPEYASYLREERQRPIREYNAALERYQGRRAQGVELATNRQERAQAERQRRADIQAQRDFEVQLDKMKFSNETARDQARQAFQLELQARNMREAEQKQKDIEDRQVRIAIGKAAQKYRDAGAKGTIPNELANRDFNPDAPVSAAADRWYSINVIAKQAQAAYLEARKAKALAGGAPGAGPLMAQLENGDVVPASEVNKATGRVILNGKPLKVTGYVGGKMPAKKQAAAPQGKLGDSLGVR